MLDEERAKDPTELREAEDEAIREAIARQIDCGLDVVTDGEFRRWMFMNSFYDAVSGVRTGKTVSFRNDRGEDVELHIHEIVDRLAPVDAPAAREAAFMRAETDGYPVQGDVPGGVDLHPSVHHGRRSGRPWLRVAGRVRRPRDRDRTGPGGRGGRGRRDDTSSSISRCIRTWSIRRGSARFEAAGHDIDGLVEAAVAADTAVLEGIPDDVTVGLHICRGNFRSSWMCEGSLEPVAERVFGGLPYDSFLVEWDDEGRDGGFESVRYLREGSVMVMGIVNSKTPVLEDEDDLMRRMDEAAGFAGGMERLAISPQCGFASVMVGNETDQDAQWRKLELVGRVADRLWGDAERPGR